MMYRYVISTILSIRFKLNSLFINLERLVKLTNKNMYFFKSEMCGRNLMIIYSFIYFSKQFQIYLCSIETKMI